MRRTCGCFGVLALLLATLAGCEPTLKQKIRPPKQPESYNLPPADDARFDKPVEFPKNTLNKDESKISRDAKDNANGPNGGPGGGGGGGGAGPSRMGAGMGGMGGGTGGP
jgi:hypothetical protein